MLGGLSARRGDEVTTRFRTRQTASLFALLCCRPGRDWSREELIDRFWPETDKASGQNSLRVSLAYLRKVLETPPCAPNEIIAATRSHIRLCPGTIQSDFAEFHAAFDAGDYALALWLYAKGPFLPGIYDEWAIDEGGRIAARAEEARRRRAPGDALAGGTTRRPADPVPNNLPIIWNRFFGRSEEMAALAALLAQPEQRLITITGPGGTGKTRLALEAARRAMTPNDSTTTTHFDGGVWFLPLTACRDAEQFPETAYAALRDALGIVPSPSADLLEQIAERTGEARLLLIWDNLEQVADGVWSALTPLLRKLPGATVLATSRARLGISGEQVVPLRSLPLPDLGPPPPDASRNPAVALFFDRARAVEVDISSSAQGTEQAAALVTRLEGVPLAIELAAAWANVLTPRQMNERISARIDSLPARRSDFTPARHASLGATAAWSCDLLSTDLRDLFYRLSVFQGGFTAEAAAEVCARSGIHAALARLLQHSLIAGVQASDGNSVRFSMPESLREYANSQIPASERDACADRHLHYLVAFAAGAKALQGTDKAHEGVRRLADEYGNIQAVLDRALTVPEEILPALTLAASLSWFWAIRGPFAPARAYLGKLLAAPAGLSPSQPRADALLASASLAYSQGEYAVSIRTVREALDLCRAIDYPAGRGSGLNNLGNALVETGDYDVARAVFEEALGLYHALGNPHREATVLSNLGNVAHWQRNLVAANRYHEAALAIRKACGDRRGEAISRVALGILCNERGEFGPARIQFLESLAVNHAMEDSYRVAHSLENIALAEEGLSRPEEAVRLLAAVTNLRIHIQMSLAPIRAHAFDEDLARLRDRLGETAFLSAWVSGTKASWQITVTQLLQGDSTSSKKI